MPQTKLQLIDKKFGRLLVLNEDLEKTKQTKKAHWYCKCDCGNYCSIIGSYLRSGGTKSCGCLRKESAKCTTNTKSGKWAGYNHITGTYWNSIRQGAMARNIKLEITIQEASDLLEKQDFKCALTGETLVVATTIKERRLQTASLDRIDSNRDYTLDNVRWVHQKINYMKLDHSDQDFIKWCTKVSNNFPEDSDLKVNELDHPKTVIST